jgi:RNA polymerase sigma-70 factor (ECF subfamily)
MPASIPAVVNPALASEAPLRPASDGAVIADLTGGLVSGEEDAFRMLHARFHDRLWHYLAVVCRGDLDAADEALQATWLRVAKHARRFDHEADLWRWLAALARSAATDGARRKNRYRAALDRYLGWFTQVASPIAAEPPEDSLERLDVLLEETLNGLAPSDRDLLVARYRHRSSIKELAQETRVSEKAMESRLARLRAFLRRRILERLAHETHSST